MKKVPNILTISRFVLSIFLLFIKPFTFSFYIIYSFCGLSDIFDGFIARKTKSESNLGSLLDTLADIAFGVVLVILFINHIDFGLIVITWITIIAGIRLVSIIIAYEKYHTFAILHTYGNKIVGLLLFIVPYFYRNDFMTVFQYLICIIASYSAIEELIIHLKSDVLNRNVKYYHK